MQESVLKSSHQGATAKLVVVVARFKLEASELVTVKNDIHQFVEADTVE